MPDTLSILKNSVLKHDEDYSYLVESGRQYIEELGSALWTDYNEHDPGITILEALCYAITELGYRTSFPIKDLVREMDGTVSASQTFFTAKKILTQSPLNKDDYRKLLIDIDGIQNAWLFSHSHYKENNGDISPAGEVRIYADPANDALTLTASDTAYPVYLRGLYKVILDLDEDPQLGDLNNGEIDITVMINTGETVDLTIVFPAWNTFNAELFSIDIENLPTLTFTPATDEQLKFTISFSFKSQTYQLQGQVFVGLQPASGPLNFNDINNIFSANSNALVETVTKLYLSKIIKAYTVVHTAIRRLNKHRNLCEDFVSVETVKDEEIAFCFDVDVIPSADIEQVEANILFVIRQYLDPDVKFYLLSEMLQKTNAATGNIYTVNEIFEGPKLKHGFIDTTELENTELRKEIYASEIISAIMNIKINDESVILAVRNFMMSAYDGEKVIPGEANQQWCIKVNEWLKPVLSREKSKIVLYKNGIPFLAAEKETDDTLQWLESSYARQKLTSRYDDITIPSGNYFPLETYTSIQHLFPQTYGIGDNGLPSTVTDERRAQARQLKAYLLFYDQLLAGFFVQLKNAKALFSTDDIKQTYFAQFVNDFKDFDSVYVQDGSNKYLFEDDVLGNQDSTIANDPTKTPAVTENPWEKLYEPNETFVDRRNRFLDHLMARFAESFNEYVFMMYNLDETTQIATAIDPEDSINSKRKFLFNYPDFSYDRAKAFNYCPLDKDLNLLTGKLWNTGNVSGLEEKVCLLAGFKDDPPVLPATKPTPSYYRRNLYSLGKYTVIPDPTTNPAGPFQFDFTAGTSQLISIKTYPDITSLVADLPQFVTFLLAEDYYSVEKVSTSPALWQIFVVDGNGTKLAQTGTFLTKKAANTAVQAFIAEFDKENDIEGLHLVEHILLRPRDKDFLPAPVCLDEDCASCGEDDPYSFRISVILPYWPSHMRNMAFRGYFEQMVRREAPAHTMVKICWVDDESMFRFETAYQSWITVLANFKAGTSDITALKNANNHLVNVLYKLHSEYPTATLHNCDESKDTNPVTLGKTVLGTTK